MASRLTRCVPQSACSRASLLLNRAAVRSVSAILRTAQRQHTLAAVRRNSPSAELHAQSPDNDTITDTTSSFTTAAHADTIYQLSTGFNTPQNSKSYAVGIAVIRISGPAANHILLHLTGRKSLPPVRQATVVRLRHPQTRQLLDSSAMCLLFNSPHSYTGEDMVELHVHGNKIVVQSVLQAIGDCKPTSASDSLQHRLPALSEHSQIRLAEAGEFTRRAFYAGKLDLTQVEALDDLLHATTEQQHLQASYQLDGSVSQVYIKWRTTLIQCLAHVEAIIDFAEDEDDVGEAEILQQIIPTVQQLHTQMSESLNDNRRGEILRDGLKIVIAGPANAGKSSLMNYLAQRDVSMVSDLAGTTRDVVDVSLDLGGYAVHIADTAGLRSNSAMTADNTADTFAAAAAHMKIEAEGIKRAHQRLQSADLKLAVFDIDSLLKVANGETVADYDNHTASFCDADTVVLLNKSDVLARAEQSSNTDNGRVSTLQKLIVGLQTIGMAQRPAALCLLSCISHEGLTSMLDTMTKQVKRRLQHEADTVEAEPSSRDTSSQPLITRQRHRQHLQQCISHLDAFNASSTTDIVLAAENLRLAARELGRIVGKIDVEQVLDVLFQDFCIGK